MTLTFEYVIKVHDKTIVQGWESGINKHEVSKKCTVVIIELEKKSIRSLRLK